jgi:hypothetical protein
MGYYYTSTSCADAIPKPLTPVSKLSESARRFYNPSVGRAPSRRQTSRSNGSKGNLYSFCRNRPTSNTDGAGTLGHGNWPELPELPPFPPDPGWGHDPIILPVVPPQHPCTIRVCCRDYTHCWIEWDQNGKKEGCSSGPKRWPGADPNIDPRPEYCRPCCLGQWGNINACCGVGSTESRTCRIRQTDQNQSNPSCLTLSHNCAMINCVRNRMMQIPLKCYAYHPLDGPNSNTAVYSALKACGLPIVHPGFPAPPGLPPIWEDPPGWRDFDPQDLTCSRGQVWQ